MANPISALEHKPSDFVREVSLDTIIYYSDELSGLFLPDEFRSTHADVINVKNWKPEDRLHGKFGRFALRHTGDCELNDILVMGTTIGLHGLDRYNNMESLLHRNLHGRARDILEERGLTDEIIGVDRADYGVTRIELDERGAPKSVSVSGLSIDFGRANAEGRQRTCELFERLLGVSVQVINVDPKPKEHDRIVA